MKEIVITENEAGQRLNKFLMKYLNQAPSGFIYKMLRKKNIKCNSKKADGSEILCQGDMIQIYLADETIEKFKGHKDIWQITTTEKKANDRFLLDVVYEDENILIANKPENVLSQKASKEDYSVNEALIDYLLIHNRLTREQLETFRPSICNRLDRNTTGLIICSTSFAGSQEINKVIKNRLVEKYYLTIIKGTMKNKMEQKCFLVKDTENNRVSIYEQPVAGKKCEEIQTAYEPLLWNEKYTLVKVQLITGKSHQIRAHLNYLGYYIIGDGKYGKQSVNRYFREHYGLTFQLLHCYTLRFQTLEGRLAYLSEKEIKAAPPQIFDKIAGDLFVDYTKI